MSRTIARETRSHLEKRLFEVAHGRDRGDETIPLQAKLD